MATWTWGTSGQHHSGLGDLSETFDKVQASEKTMPAVVYGCYIGAILWGVTMIVGVAIAYVYRGSASPALTRTHYDYQISIFWKSLIGLQQRMS